MPRNALRQIVDKDDLIPAPLFSNVRNRGQVDCLKGQCHEFSLFLVFSQPQSIPLEPFQFFFENSWRYSQVKVHHRYQWHRGHILPPVSLVLLIPVAKYGKNIRLLKVNLKAWIYIYVNSTTQRCPNKIIKKISDWRLFPFATGVNDTGGAPWAANLREFLEKIWNSRNGMLRWKGGNWFMKKTRSRKSRGTVPLNI